MACSELIVASVNSWLITHYWSGWDLSACHQHLVRSDPAHCIKYQAKEGNKEILLKLSGSLKTVRKPVGSTEFSDGKVRSVKLF